MRLFVIAALAASAVALPAAAQSEAGSGFKPQFSVSGGYARFADGSEEWDGHSGVARVSARLHRNFGIEAEGALGLGSSDIGGVDVKMNHNVAAYAVVYWPAGDNFDLYARAGLGSTEFEFDFGGGSVVTESFDGPVMGIGGQYFFDANNGARMDVTRHEYDAIDGGFDSVAFTYVRRF